MDISSTEVIWSLQFYTLPICTLVKSFLCINTFTVVVAAISPCIALVVDHTLVHTHIYKTTINHHHHYNNSKSLQLTKNSLSVNGEIITSKGRSRACTHSHTLVWNFLGGLFFVNFNHITRININCSQVSVFTIMFLKLFSSPLQIKYRVYV